MAIVKMKRLRLAAVRTQREELLRELMLLGCVEISQPENLPVDDELIGLLSRESAGWFERKGDCEELLLGISLLDKYAPKKTSLFSARPEIESSAILDETDLDEALELAKKLDHTDDHIRTVDAEINHIKGVLDSLQPWKAMDAPLDMTETRTCFITTGTIPSSFELRDMENELETEGCEAAAFEISADENVRYLLFTVMKDRQAASAEVLRKFGFAQSSVSGLHGTVKENIDRLNRRLEEIEVKKAALADEIRQAAPMRDDLKLCSDRMMTKAEQAEHAERLLYTRSAFIFEGWFPRAAEPQLQKLLEKYDCAWETREPTEEEIPEVPIKLNSNAATRPFTMVTEMYSLPAYNGIDPNGFLFPTFALFFGIMFADIGYGLIMLLTGLVMKLKIRPRSTMGYMGGMAIICGISCMIFGAITGTFFGDIIPQMASFFGGSATMPVLIDPLKDPMTILIICIGIGVVHMLIGVTINGYMLLRDGQWFDALCDVGTVYLTFAGVALGALGITWYVLYAGVILIILTQGRASPSIGGKIGSGLWGLYNFVTGWFGDILSYCRLMALMLAGTVIAQVFNTLGAMTGNIIAFLFIFLVGHALNFGLNIIGTYVHTSRLEYLEFFGKFYREGGRAFAPMTIKTNYYDLYN